MQNEQRKRFGAWKKQTSKGEVINFTINGQKYSMWHNTRKQKPTDPDFNILEDNYQPQQQAQAPISNDDDIPF